MRTINLQKYKIVFTGDKFPIMRNAVRVESNRKAIRLLRGWLDKKAGSTSSVPLEVSSGGVSPASANAEFSSSNNGSSVVVIALCPDNSSLNEFF